MSIDKTFLRTNETMEKYIKDNKDGKTKNFLVDLEKKAIKKFHYWMIVPNEYPYDYIADVNDLIFPIRKIPFDWDLLNEEEKKNYMN